MRALSASAMLDKLAPMTPGAFIVREAKPCDAELLLGLQLQLDSETHFMMLEPGERAANVAELQAELARIEGCRNSVILVAHVSSAPELAGYIGARGGAYRRNHHVADLVLGVRQKYAGRGIGTALLRDVEAWAAGAGVHRLELTVMAHNHRAIGLYRRVGFDQEGIRRAAMRVTGTLVDELMMAKLLLPS